MSNIAPDSATAAARRPRRQRADRGSVLVLALLVTLLILGVGLTAMWISSSGNKVSGNLTRKQEALFAAETGIERARAIFAQPTANWEALLRGDHCSPTPAYDTKKGMLLCTGAPLPVKRYENLAMISASEAVNTTAKIGDMSRMVYTVYVRNDDAEYAHCDGVDAGEGDAGIGDTGDCDSDGDSDSVDVDIRRYRDVDRRIVIRAEGRGRDGVSYTAVEVVIAANVLSPTAACYAQKGGCGGGNTNSGNISMP